MDKLSLAIKFATALHKNQKRKYTGADHIAHPLRVALYTATNGGTEDMAIAAALHDTVEATKITFEEIRCLFGRGVGGLVFQLTNPSEILKNIGNRKTRKELDLAFIAKVSPEAKTIKLFDRLDNLNEIDKEDSFAAVYSKESRDLVAAIGDGGWASRKILNWCDEVDNDTQRNKT